MSLFSIFKNKLSKTSNILSFNILEILKNKKIDDLTLEELENVLISSDISLDVVNQLIDSIKKIKISNDDGIKNVLEILAQKCVFGAPGTPYPRFTPTPASAWKIS